MKCVQKVAVFGDMGIYNSKATVTDLHRVRSSIDFLLTIGDQAYADDDYLKNPFVDKYEATWNAFMNMIQPFASVLPYMVSVKASWMRFQCSSSMYDGHIAYPAGPTGES
jgi:hypothetical protein